MNPRDHYEIETKTVMDLAEYFPGGGTDFQRPLDAALECLQHARFKKGDVIFITDGECQVATAVGRGVPQRKGASGIFAVLNPDRRRFGISRDADGI